MLDVFCPNHLADDRSSRLEIETARGLWGPTPVTAPNHLADGRRVDCCVGLGSRLEFGGSAGDPFWGALVGRSFLGVGKGAL